MPPLWEGKTPLTGPVLPGGKCRRDGKGRSRSIKKRLATGSIFFESVGREPEAGGLFTVLPQPKSGVSRPKTRVDKGVAKIWLKIS